MQEKNNNFTKKKGVKQSFARIPAMLGFAKNKRVHKLKDEISQKSTFLTSNYKCLPLFQQ